MLIVRAEEFQIMDDVVKRIDNCLVKITKDSSVIRLDARLNEDLALSSLQLLQLVSLIEDKPPLGVSVWCERSPLPVSLCEVRPTCFLV